MIDAQIEKQHFLNDKQKKIKQKIMERLIDAFNLSKEETKLFDLQEFTDLHMSCMIYFVRDFFTHFFLNSNALGSEDKLLNEFFKIVKAEIKAKLDYIKREQSCTKN
jgi:hypothetical protein